jgi:hypothetical protein
MDPVPVTGFAENFSPIPRIAPPPFGRDMDGTLTAPELAPASFAEVSVLELCALLV